MAVNQREELTMNESKYDHNFIQHSLQFFIGGFFVTSS